MPIFRNFVPQPRRNSKYSLKIMARCGDVNLCHHNNSIQSSYRRSSLDTTNELSIGRQSSSSVMPRVVQPGEKSGKIRVRYKPRRKLAIISSVRRIMEEEKLSLVKASEMAQVHYSLVSKWTKESDILRNAIKSKKKSSHPGPIGQLQPIEDKLLRFIFEQREMGMPINILMVVLFASTISTLFSGKSIKARFSAVRRFVKQHSLVYRMGTHESQRHPEEVKEEAHDFLSEMKKMVVGPHRDQRFIINMDQTPVYFSMAPSKTLDLIGRKTIHVRKSTNDTKRATVAATITASGHILPAMVVFKGAKNGRIATTEFQDYPSEHFYACQKNAWMDERVMLLWAEKILKPYIDSAPDHVIPLVILDSYRCHMMSSVVHAIQEMGVEVTHIPGGCTSLCQPVDVGFNKPFKSHIRQDWESWMLFEGLVHGTTSAPTREEVAGWIAKAFRHMQGSPIVKNAWLKTDYEWFDVEK